MYSNDVGYSDDIPRGFGLKYALSTPVVLSEALRWGESSNETV